jgi:Putative transmembrane protein (PGPGW)
VFDWLYSSSLVWLLFVLSIATFASSLIAIPWILVRLPPHYFDERHPRLWLNDHHPVLRGLGLGLKNLLGVLFVLAGIAMLVLPGQGLLTMLIGVSLLDFPGKRDLERKIISFPMVLQTINRLRERFGESSLIVYPHCDLVDTTTGGGTPPDKSAGS